MPANTFTMRNKCGIITAMRTTNYSPRFTVTIKDFATMQDKATITDEIISITTTKAYQRCLGTWSINLIPKKDSAGLRYDQTIVPSDHITIAMSTGDGTQEIVVMTGLVNRIASSRHMGSGGQYQRVIRISGSDLGKMLMTEIGWDISPAQILVGGNTEATWQDRKAIMVGTPARTITNIYHQVIEKGYINLPNHIVADQIREDDNWTVLQSSGYLADQTPIWQAMMQFENRPFNALWCDTDDAGKFHIGLEAYPLDSLGFVNRPPSLTITIEDHQITGEDVGTSDEERVNLVTLETPILKYADGNYGFPLSLTSKLLTNLNKDSINQYGFKPHIITTEFIPPSVKESNQNVDVPSEAETRATLFWNWYKDNHTLESGSINIHGNPRIRAGMQLDHKGRGKSYLIEQVTHEFSVWPQVSFTTNLEITRGRKTQG